MKYKRKLLWKTGSESKKNQIKEMGKGKGGDGKIYKIWRKERKQK